MRGKQRVVLLMNSAGKRTVVVLNPSFFYFFNPFFVMRNVNRAMNKLFLLILTFCCTDLFSQTVAEFMQGKRFYQSIDFTYGLSFDSTEIMERKFKTAVVMVAITYDEGDRTYLPNDTTAIYKFDENGKVYEETFMTHGRIDLIVKYDEHGEMISENTKTVTLKSGKNKIVNKFNIYLEDGKLDTSTTRIYTYNERNLLIEEQLITSRETINRRGCLNGATMHVKYDYDQQGRLIRFQNLEAPSQYVKITYPDYGKFVEWRQLGTDSLIASEMVLINKTDGVTSYSNSVYQVTVASLEKGSKLLHKVLLVGIQEHPTFEEYTVKYSEN